ncbi:hypothetical protein ACH5RR_028883, partial [Cinchona calisaya]
PRSQEQLSLLLQNYEGFEEFRIAIDELNEKEHVAFADDNMDPLPSQEPNSDPSTTSITTSHPAQDSIESENIVIHSNFTTNKNISGTIIDNQSGYITDDEDDSSSDFENDNNRVEIGPSRSQRNVKAEMKKILSKNESKNPIPQVIHPYGIGCFGVNNSRENVPSVYDLFHPKPIGIMALLPYAGTSSANASISIMNVGKNVPTTFVPYAPNEIGSDVGGAIPPNHKGFNHGFGSTGQF